MTDTAGRGAPRGSAKEWALVVLSWAAVLTNGWLLLALPSDVGLRHGVRVADLVLCILLGLAICWRWLRFRSGRRLLRKHWWEVVALFPLIVVVPGDWHALLWLVLLARIVRAVDRTDTLLGDRVTADLVRHFSDPIVNAIKRPITIAVLDEVVAVLHEGTYAANVRIALEENRAEIEAMVVDLVRQDAATGKFRLMPFHDTGVTLVTDAILRLVNGILDDPRTTELISDVIAHSGDQIRAAIRRPHEA